MGGDTSPVINTLEVRSELHTSETDNSLYFISAIFVDNEAVVDFRYYATSLIELQQSLVRDGTYFILTCWCGVPECAKIYDGVQVAHAENTVEWIIIRPQPQRVFTFASSA